MRVFTLVKVCALLLLVNWIAGYPEDAGSRTFSVVLDPGHTINKPGAISTTGVGEVHYNNRLCTIITDTLAAYHVKVHLTRQSDEEITLGERVTMANALDVLAFIALHHDSTQPKYLDKINNDSGFVYSTITPITGYSIFVSSKNSSYDKSIELAKCVAKELLALGRKPTLHHAEPIEGENRPLIDSVLGIYKFDDLKVLKEVSHPSILIEFGVLVDKQDESYVSDTVNQKRFASAIYKGLVEFGKR